MTWFERGKSPEPRPAVFTDLTATARAVPGWVVSPGNDVVHDSGVFTARGRPLFPCASPPTEPPPPAALRSAAPPALDRACTAPPPAPGVTLSTPPTSPPPAPSSARSQPPPAAGSQRVPPAPPEELLRSLQSAVERTAGLRDQVLKETERQLVALAAKIARKVISHELTVAPEIMLALAAEGMDALEDRDRLVVRFGEGLDELAVERFRKRLRADNPRVEVMRDLRLAPWDCVVETELGRVDESVDARLGKVMEALLGRDAGL